MQLPPNSQYSDFFRFINILSICRILNASYLKMKENETHIDDIVMRYLCNVIFNDKTIDLHDHKNQYS